MSPFSPTRKMTLTAVCMALCVVLPIAFHMVPNAGPIFLPMHIPVLLCGLVCGWPYGMLCGLLGPLLSSVLTGMPMAPVLPSMMVECAAYGAVAGGMMKLVHTSSAYGDLYVSLPTAMLAGRFLAGITKALVFAPGTGLRAWVMASFVTALPGIVIQLAALPTLAVLLSKAGLIPNRYPKKSL